VPDLLADPFSSPLGVGGAYNPLVTEDRPRLFRQALFDFFDKDAYEARWTKELLKNCLGAQEKNTGLFAGLMGQLAEWLLVAGGIVLAAKALLDSKTGKEYKEYAKNIKEIPRTIAQASEAQTETQNAGRAAAAKHPDSRIGDVALASSSDARIGFGMSPSNYATLNTKESWKKHPIKTAVLQGRQLARMVSAGTIERKPLEILSEVEARNNQLYLSGDIDKATFDRYNKYIDEAHNSYKDLWYGNELLEGLAGVAGWKDDVFAHDFYGVDSNLARLRLDLEEEVFKKPIPKTPIEEMLPSLRPPRSSFDAQLDALIQKSPNGFVGEGVATPPTVSTPKDDEVKEFLRQSSVKTQEQVEQQEQTNKLLEQLLKVGNTKSPNTISIGQPSSDLVKLNQGVFN